MKKTIRILRLNSNSSPTAGVLYLNEDIECFTLEDRKRDIKVHGDTRIPAGTYGLAVRNYGGHHNKYGLRFPSIHEGMIEVVGVPGFTDILIHIGNFAKDTDGCILVGGSITANNGKPYLSKSEDAYISLYQKIILGVIDGTYEIKIEEA